MALPLPSAFHHRDFRLLQGARFLSILGIQVQSVAVGWQVYAITGRPLDLGYVGLAQFLPAFGLSLVTGHVADRFDRRTIIAICQATIALCSLALLALARAHTQDPVPIYGVLLAFGVARAFAGPASQALLPSLVPKNELGNAIAWSSSIFEIASISGPALGGLVYAAQGAEAAYGFTALATALATLFTLRIRPRPRSASREAVSLNRVFDGIRYVFREKVLLGAISLDLFAVLLGGAVALLPAYARDVLHVGPSGLGLLRSAPAMGALLMALVLATRPLKHRVGLIMFACVAIFGVATIVFGLSTSFPLSLAALFVLGASDMVSVVIRQTLVQVTTPEAMRGRVSAVNLVFVGASNELGEFESGITAAWLGLVPAVVVGGVGTLVVVALWAYLFPSLRRADRLEAAPVSLRPSLPNGGAIPSGP